VDFQVRREDIRQCRFVDSPDPEPAAGQAVLEVERFGLTSNNVTYAVMGDAMSYWRFFPAEEGWGRIPVWGFARVVAGDALPAGARFYGYWPPSSHALVAPHPEGGGFVDAAPHRAELPPVYNSYVPAATEPAPDEDEQMLFRPLFATSFLIGDFLDEHDLFGAGSVLISSASSKTALGTAFILRGRDDVEVVGLTSSGRAEFVRGLNVYDRVVPYDDLESAPAEAAVYVDISGDARVRASVHGHYGDSLAYDCAVGASHWDRVFEDVGPLPGPAPEIFFAPDRITKRRADWGPGAIESRVSEEWEPFAAWVAGWLDVVHGGGAEDVERAYLELLDGGTPPARGYAMSLTA
jgi:Protein of unknown function (DUF2855)